MHFSTSVCIYGAGCCSASCYFLSSSFFFFFFLLLIFQYVSFSQFLSPTSHLQFEVSWFGSESQSGIYKYEVGLSSTSSEVMDLLPYTSTHGHRHFVSFCPNLMDEQTFYVHIRATSKAGLQTTKVNVKLAATAQIHTF